MATWHFMDSGTGRIAFHIITLRGARLWRLAAVGIIPNTVITFFPFTKQFWEGLGYKPWGNHFRWSQRALRWKKMPYVSFAYIYIKKKSWNFLPWCFYAVEWFISCETKKAIHTCPHIHTYICKELGTKLLVSWRKAPRCLWNIL